MSEEGSLCMETERELLSIHDDVEVMAPRPFFTRDYMISYASRRIHFTPLTEGLQSLFIQLDEPATCLAFSAAPTDNQLAVSSPRTLQLFGTPITSPVTTVHKPWRHGHKAYICRMSFSANGTLLATASSDGAVRLWKVSDTQCVYSKAPTASCTTALKVFELATRTTSIEVLAFASCDLSVLTLPNEEKHMRYVEGDKCHTSQIVDILPIGKDALVTIGLDKLLCLWHFFDEDQPKLCVICRIALSDNDIVALLESGPNRFYAVSRRGKYEYWASNGKKLTIANKGTLAYADAYSEDCEVFAGADYVAVYDRNDGIVDTYHKDSLNHHRTMLVNTIRTIGSVHYCNQGGLLVQAGKSVIVLCPEGSTCQRLGLPPIQCYTVCAQRGQLIACTCKNELWTLALGDNNEKAKRKMKLQGEAKAIASCHDGKRMHVACGFDSGAFMVWSGGDQCTVRSAPGKDFSAVSLLLWARPGALAACSTVDRVDCAPPVLFNVKRDEFIKLKVHKAHLRAVDLQCEPSNKLFAIAFSDGNVHLYDSASGDCVQTVESTTNGATSIRLGVRLLVGHRTGLVSSYNIESCSLLGTWKVSEELAVDPVQAIVPVTEESKSDLYVVVTQMGLYWLRDKTKEKQAEKVEKAAALVARQQLLDNLLKQPDKQAEALKVCLQGDHRWTALNIVEGLTREQVIAVINSLNFEETKRLASWLVDWNCFAGNRGYTAQLILNCLLTQLHRNDFEKCFSNRALNALLLYSKRKQNQFRQLARSVQFLQFLCGE